MTDPGPGPRYEEPTLRPDGSMALCVSCGAAGRCTLGIGRELPGPDGGLRFELACPAEYEAGPQVAHGRWAMGALDEMLGHVPLHRGVFAVTATLTVDFLRPIPIGVPLVASARVVERSGRKWVLEGEVALPGPGAELATARGLYLELSPDRHFAAHRRWLAEAAPPGPGPVPPRGGAAGS